MHIFLTGATGFLGSHVIDLLAKQGHQMTALVRSSSNKSHLQQHGVHLIEGALPDAGPLANILSGMDAIVHIAGAVQAKTPDDFFRINHRGTEFLVQEALKAPTPPKLFLHISTIAVHQPNAENNFELPAETCCPLSYYGESKRLAELSLQSLAGKIPYTVLRPPVLYGPRDSEFLPFFKAIRLGLAPLLGGGPRRLSVCYGPDVAEAIVRMVQQSPPENNIYTIDDGQIYTWQNLAASIAKAMGKNPKLIAFPVWAFYLAAFFNEIKVRLTGRADVFTVNKMRELRANPWICGNQSLQRHLGWAPPTLLEAGMQKTFRDYCERGQFKKINSGRD